MWLVTISKRCAPNSISILLNDVVSPLEPYDVSRARRREDFLDHIDRVAHGDGRISSLVSLVAGGSASSIASIESRAAGGSSISSSIESSELLQPILAATRGSSISCSCQWECLKVLSSSSGYLISLVLTPNESITCEAHQCNVRCILVAVLERFVGPFPLHVCSVVMDELVLLWRLFCFSPL